MVKKSDRTIFKVLSGVMYALGLVSVLLFAKGVPYFLGRDELATVQGFMFILCSAFVIFLRKGIKKEAFSLVFSNSMIICAVLYAAAQFCYIMAVSA